VALCRHSGGFKLAPLKNGAGIQSFQSRGTRDWTPAFAGVTGRENVIISWQLRLKDKAVSYSVS
jgi:hypothetical protein